MKFRHPNGARLTLPSGQVALVGPEWRELDDQFYQEALVRGCEVDTRVIESREDAAPQGSDSAPKVFDEAVAIREALELMRARNEQGDLTGSGMPNLNVVSGLAKIPVKKEMVYAIWHELENAAKPDPAADIQPAA